jgi:hypothetical protein
MENQNREEVRIHLKSMNDEMKKKIKGNKAMLTEMIARMDANHEKRMARMDAWLKDMRIFRRETTACQGMMEARPEEDKPASVDTTPEVEDDQEIPVEDAEVRSVAEPRRRRRDQLRDLAAAPPEETGARPGRGASQERIGTGPEERWVPKERGRHPQRGELFCATQNSTNKRHYTGVLWTQEGIGRCSQRDDLPGGSGTTQERRHQERT